MNDYLWEFAQKLPSDNHFQLVLKSALSVRACGATDLDKTNNKWMCRKCKTLWMHGQFQVEEIPATEKLSGLVEKLENKPCCNKKQQNFKNYLESRKRTVVKYTCKLCSYKTRIALKAESNARPLVGQSKKEVPTVVAASSGNKKKRKHKRDPTAGLTIPTAVADSRAAGKFKQPTAFNNKQSSQLHALAARLKQKSNGAMQTIDRLKLLLK
ncbi:uncharacterized protein LOC129779809 [Toxorhynchites rutilus septentrionalis]|uniref:uncharacterized protein LOC129779809 n=1 Tax=Toxorhynchites rutilus septentrionalis TaxID=329112 RepID=UPI00247845F7|nr:uncharacterized protein LOC129779809 [Toxorhynchites rutilus septentrionalis]XP_055643495.1 uncharacterized protein LOC129779809 [Toxorhynchites rutilus septentrionalis]